MSSIIPPELPKLPPVRESAEQVLPAAVEGPPVEPAGPPEHPSRGDRGRQGRSPRERPPQARARTSAGPRGGAPEAPPSEGGRRRNGRIRYSDDGRRLSSAGNALIVAVLALVLGALLLAPGMHKAAFNGQPGTKRDVSLALTAGLVRVSHALLLDRPRALVQDAMGRQNADQIDVTIVAPPPPTVRPATGPTSTTPTRKPSTKPAGPKTPARIVFTPTKRLRIWIAGDSLVITPGYSIVRAAGGSPVIQSVGGVDGHVGTGLTRPDVFNWYKEIATQVKLLKPNVVVLNFGGNDNHGYMTGLPPGTSIGDFASPSWSAEYLRRVRVVMDMINHAGATVVWIGLPIVSSPSESADFDKLNAIVQREAKRRPGKAIFIDTYTMFAGANGGFTQYLQNGNGDNVKVRAGDGVHFDPAGGDMIAREVMRQLNQQFDLTSWRKHKNA